jgi:hypothetical protein
VLILRDFTRTLGLMIASSRGTSILQFCAAAPTTSSNGLRKKNHQGMN